MRCLILAMTELFATHLSDLACLRWRFCCAMWGVVTRDSNCHAPEWCYRSSENELEMQNWCP
jgi:hypothetical protein